MAKVVWEHELHNDPYEAIGCWIDNNFGCDNSYIVQLLTKRSEEDDWSDITVLYNINTGWENEWWDGEEFIEIIAVAPVKQIDISESFNVADYNDIVVTD